MPTPSAYVVGVQDIVKAERNARGTIIIEWITTKQKLELAWNYLSGSDLAFLLSAVNVGFFTVDYLDPLSNDYRSGIFYVGDRSAGMIDFRNGFARYKDIKFNLIEK